MNAYIGELSALATALFFSATSTMFTLAGRQVGSVVLNRSRLVLAVLFLTSAHFILDIPLPAQAGADRWFWLGLSGVIGLVLGDAFLFQAFVWIGPRLSMLLMALAPVLAALTAWVFLAESLTPLQVLGILITLFGVAVVVLERSPNIGEQRDYLRGLLFGLGAATGQAFGLIAAKKGLGGDFPALSGTLIRMLVAMVALWLFTAFIGQAGATVRRLAEHRRALGFILVGSLTGPFLGVTFSLLAIQRTQVGIASTIMALPPVFLLPIGYIVFHERFGWRAVGGTILAMLGVGVLFLA